MEEMIGLPRGVLALFLFAMLGIAYLDYSTGKEVAVWGLYLIPVGIASWMGGMRAGILLSVVSCVLMFIDGMYSGTNFSGTGFFLLGILNRFIALLIVSWLASYLFHKQMLESTLQSYEECMDYLHASPQKETDHEAAHPLVPDAPAHPPADRSH
jgi:hypothetical protein